MSLAIVGLGTALPDTCITQAEAVKVAQVICCRTERQAKLVPGLYRHSAIGTRYLSVPRQVVEDVLHGTRTSESVFLPSGAPDDRGPTAGQRMAHYAREAGPLAVRAARRALDRSRLPPHAITHLVTVSCTGFSAPGVDIELIRKLELPPTTQRTHVGFMGCHATINGLRVARAFATADPGTRILVCAVELCGLHFSYQWDPERVVANALFADGAAAVITAPVAAAPTDAWRVEATGACLFPDSERAMTWNIGDHGFEMTLSAEVPGLIARHLRGWLEDWLGDNGLALQGVASWAVHPGGARIVSAVAETLGLSAEAVRDSRAVLAEHGNMSSPTILFILERLQARRAPRPCVALGFGPGLVAEAMLLR